LKREDKLGRPVGTRNPGFDARRDALATALIARVVASPAPSFRELAEAAGVSVPTLRHYFDDRDGAVAACLAAMHRLGAAPMARGATDEIGPLEPSLAWFLGQFRLAWERFGVGPMIAAGLAEGLASKPVGPAFVNELLEPTLQSAEARLAAHLARGDLGPCDLRHAGLALVSPVLLALLHQESLGGAGCRPLDVDTFVADHVRRFVRAFGA
jgi:AcrR family transcriptional regulator